MMNHCVILYNEIHLPFWFDDVYALKICTQKQWQVVKFFTIYLEQAI